jgi:sugar phosphate isomerase/epimerase
VKGDLSRREWLAGASAAAGAALAASQPAPAADKASESFVFCLNTATIMGQKLSLAQEIDIAGKAGYQAIEPWVNKIEEHARGGGNLKDIAKRVRDHGLTVADAIGFCEWIVDDEGRRKKGLEAARRSMDLVRQIGGQRLAAPPAGAVEQTDLSLSKITDRYRALLELGDQMGVVPQLEVWGFSKTLSRLGEAAHVAIDTGHRNACVLADVYHQYKGGSGFGGLKLLSGAALQVIHMNDYPASPARAQLTDAHRIYPGDGIAPLKQMLKDLRSLGFRGVLSLEVFNPEYWMKDAMTVARTGLEKMRAVARASME